MSRDKKRPLSSLSVGQKGLVISIAAEGMTRRRLLDLGLVPGTEVKALRKSPLGDPTAFSIRGAVIALRMEESSKVIMQPVHT